MSSNNRPWKEVNLIRRYEEKNLNRLSKKDMEELDEGVIQNVTNAIGNLKTKVANNQAARATKKANAAQQKATAAQQKADNTFISNFGKQVDNLTATYNPSTPQKWLATAINNDTADGAFKKAVGKLSAVAISNGIENLVNNSNNKGQINGARVDGILNKVNSLNTNQVYGKDSFKTLIDKISKLNPTPVPDAPTPVSNGTPAQPATEASKPAAQSATGTVNKTPEQPADKAKEKPKDNQTTVNAITGDNTEYNPNQEDVGNESLHRKNPNRLKESRGLNILSI